MTDPLDPKNDPRFRSKVSHRGRYLPPDKRPSLDKRKSFLERNNETSTSWLLAMTIGPIAAVILIGPYVLDLINWIKAHW